MSEEYSREVLASKWEEFFSDFGYVPRIKAVADAYPEKRSLCVPFDDLDRYDSDFGAYLFHRPRTMLNAGEKQIREMLPSGAEGAEITLRIINLPQDKHVDIRNIRSKHQGRFIAVTGLVKRVTEVRPRILDAVFECMRCGHHTHVQQEETMLREPLECSKENPDENGIIGCGRGSTSTSFKLLYEISSYIDAQKIELQELPEEMKGGAQPQSLTIQAEDDLTGDVQPGDRVKMNGILRSKLRDITRQRTTLFDIYLELNSTEQLEPEYKELDISPEDAAKIKEMAADERIYAKIVQSISPTIYGLDVEKEALALQLFGGIHKDMPDGTKIRGDIHVLLVGDPGTAKSQLLRYISDLTPRGIYASGKSSTGAGLTATAIKDEFGEGRWTLEAGALVLSDKGIAAIDELDKMNDQDRSSMHEAMEQQTISVAKAGITATLQARCAVLGAANPKFGRFDSNVSIVEQINLPATLLSRFDLIFPISDTPDQNRDAMVATHILKSHLLGEALLQKKQKGSTSLSDEQFDSINASVVPAIAPELLRKYVSTARQITPVMTPEAMEVLKGYYLSVRRGGGSQGGGERRPSVPITPRQLEAYIRLSEASAKVRLSETITADDANRAIRIFKEYMNRVIGLGREGEQFWDVDRVETGIPQSQRDEILAIKEIIRELQGTTVHGAPIADIMEKAKAKGMSEERVSELISMLQNRSGDILSRKSNHYSLAEMA